MLADPLPDDHEYWARQVLRHWYIDGAAVGAELQVSRSVGAVDGRTGESSEPVVVVGVGGDDEVKGARLRNRLFWEERREMSGSGVVESGGVGGRKVGVGSGGVGFNFF